MTRYYYSRDGTHVQGPISDIDLRGMHSTGLLGDDAQICEEGTESWLPITSIKAPSAESPSVPAAVRIETAKYICPRCGSGNIQSVSILYEAGTSTSISRGRVIGVAGLGTDHLTPAGGMTTTTLRQQTLLAARYSPPQPAKASNDATAWWFILVALLIGFGVVLFEGWLTESPHPVLGFLCIIGGTAVLIPASRAAKAMHLKQKELTKAYVKQLAEWQQSFVCQKCGYFGTLRHNASDAPQISPDLLFAVVLRSIGRNKIGVIRAVRSARPELDLADAKHFVENVPQVLLQATSETEARRIAYELTQIGAVAEIAPSHYAAS